MRNVPITVNQNIFLNNIQERELTDIEVTLFIQDMLANKKIAVKRVERGATGDVKHVYLSII